MAKVRIGYGTDFVVENEMVGIRTDASFSELDLFGGLHATGINNTGVTTLTSYDGFFDSEVQLSKSTIDLNSESGSLSDEIIIDGEVTVSSGTTITSGLENLTVKDSFTLPGISDDKPIAGSTRYNENLESLEFYTGSEWRAVNSRVDMGNLGRAVFMGGGNSPLGDVKTIDYFSMITKGNAINFGDTLTAESRRSGCGSEIRGLSAGSDDASNHEVIEYITIESEGNSVDFGDMFNGRGTCASFSSSTRGIWAGGRTPGPQDTIDYVEIATTGDAKDFGDVRNAKQWLAGCSSPTRGIIAGGEGPAYPSPTRTRDIEYVTIASKGDSLLFGDLTGTTGNPAGFSNSIRGFFAGGEPRNWMKIDMINIASTGNAIYFGDLRQGRIVVNGTASQTRGFIMGGMNNPPGVYVNIIESVEISSSGSAVDWGDLTIPRWAGASISDSHGGLGGF